MSSNRTSWDPAEDPDAEARGFNPPRTNRLWRDILLPRTTWPMFWAYWVLLLPSRVLPRRPRAAAVTLAIESGRIGWTHVFYEELLQSADEYLGGAPIVRVEIDRDRPYLPQFRAAVSEGPMTHLILDPRTGSQTWGRALVDLLVMAWMLTRRGIVPIVVLTDASFRRHRLQAAVLTAFRGVVVTFMSADLIAPLFPHRRIIGPLPMPVSVRRLEWLEQVRAGVPEPERASVRFIGSVYPPRAQFLERLSEVLASRGIELRINADKYGTSNDDYWTILATSDVIITTTLQGMPRPYMDWIWHQQLVFRFSEALSAGAVLVSPAVAGGDRFFRPLVDFVPFTSVSEAAGALESLVTGGELLRRIQAAGHETAARLDRDHAFWRDIDGALGADRIRR